jgi:WD40 repeat protein
MRFFHALILFLFILLVLSGCSSPNSEITTVTTTSSATPAPTTTAMTTAATTGPTTTAGTQPTDPPLAGQPELIWRVWHDNPIHCLALSPDGQTVAGGEYKVTYIRHLYDGSLVNVAAHEHTVEDLAFLSGGSFLAAGQGYYGIQLTDLAGLTEPVLIGDGHNNRLAISPDDLQMATGNRDGLLRLWQLSAHTQTAVLEAPGLSDKTIQNRWIIALEYHPAGQLLAVTHSDDEAMIWDVNDQQVIHHLQLAADVNRQKILRFSPDGLKLAGAMREGRDTLIRIWTVDGFAQQNDLVVPERVREIAFSPDSRLLAVASRLATTILDVTTGQSLYTLDQTIAALATDSPVAVSFTPDGGHLAVARSDGSIELWRLPGAQAIDPPPVDIRMPPPLPGDVLFDTGSAALKETAHEQLTEVALQLHEAFVKATLTFVGHTDSRGSAAANLQLSLARATAIRDWFSAWANGNGVTGWTLLVDGRGANELKAPDTNVEGTFLPEAGSLNRRVEIEIASD